jgi:hypothetical protein
MRIAHSIRAGRLLHQSAQAQLLLLLSRRIANIHQQLVVHHRKPSIHRRLEHGAIALEEEAVAFDAKPHNR